MDNLIEAEVLNSPAEILLHEALPSNEQNNYGEREAHSDQGAVENQSEDEVGLNILRNESSSKSGLCSDGNEETISDSFGVGRSSEGVGVGQNGENILENSECIHTQTSDFEGMEKLGHSKENTDGLGSGDNIGKGKNDTSGSLSPACDIDNESGEHDVCSEKTKILLKGGKESDHEMEQKTTEIINEAEKGERETRNKCGGDKGDHGCLELKDKKDTLDSVSDNSETNIGKDGGVKEVDTCDESNLEVKEEATNIGDTGKTKSPEIMMQSSEILYDECEESLESDSERHHRVSEVGNRDRGYLEREKECTSYSEMERKGKNESTVNNICEPDCEGEYEGNMENAKISIRGGSNKGVEKCVLENTVDEYRVFEKKNASIFEIGSDCEDFEIGKDRGSGESINEDMNSEGKENNVINEHCIVNAGDMTSSEHKEIKENEGSCALTNKEECIEKETESRFAIAVKETNTEMEKKNNLEVENDVTSHEKENNSEESDDSKCKKKLRTELEASVLESKDANNHKSGVISCDILQEHKHLTEETQKEMPDQPGAQEASTKDTLEQADRESLGDRKKTVDLHKSLVNAEESEGHGQSPEVVTLEAVKDTCNATSRGDKEQSSQHDGDAACVTRKTPLGQKNTARKSTSKVKPKTLRDPADEALNTKSTARGKRRGEEGQRRGDVNITPVSSHLKDPFPKGAPKGIMQRQRSADFAEMSEIVHVDMPTYVEHAGPPKNAGKSSVTSEGLVPQRQPSTTSLQEQQQFEDTDDSDIEILSEIIRSPMNAISPGDVASIVCDVCQLLWNDNVLEAIFEGTKCVTVNSKITYGAILCFNVYAGAHYLHYKEQAVRNVLERADLGKNIGNLKITQVMNWLSSLMRCGSVKCCDVFDAVYSPENANTILDALMNTEHSSEDGARQQSTQRPVKETSKRKNSNSCQENFHTIASSGTIESTSPVATPVASKTKSTRKAVKSKHTQANTADSSASSGVVLKKCQVSLKKSDLPLDETPVNSEVVLKKCQVSLKKSDLSLDLVSSSEKSAVLKECSVYLGKRMQLPLWRTCLQLYNSSPAALKVTKQPPGQEGDQELPPRKKVRDIGHTLSAKRLTDAEGSSKSGNEKEAAEQTASKNSTSVVQKQSVEEDGSQESTEDNGMSASVDNTDSLEDEINEVMPLVDGIATRTPKHVTDKIMIKSEESTGGPDRNTSEKDQVGVQEEDKIKSHDHSKRFLKLDKKSIKSPSRSEKTLETNIKDQGNQTDSLKQEAPTDESFRNSLSKCKKRPAVDPTTQSTKKQRLLSESLSVSSEERESSECLPEATEGESTVPHRKTRNELKCLGSNLKDSESFVSPSLEDMSSSLSDGPPQSCESSDASDDKASGERSVSPRGKARSVAPSEKKLLKSIRTLRTRSHRATGAKIMVSSSDTSSDSNDRQVMHAGGSAPQSRTCVDYILGIPTENTEESENMLIQKLGLNINATNLYCNVTDTKISTNGDMVANPPERCRSSAALQVMLKERSNLDGVAREAFDLLPFEPNNFTIVGNSSNKERFLTNQELLVMQNICVLNPENPDVDMFYQILIQVLLARRRVLLVPNSLSLLLVAEKVRRDFNRVKRKGNYILYLAQDWDVNKIYTSEDFWLAEKKPPKVPTVRTVLSMFCLWKNLEKRFPISFPIALEELCRNIVLWNVDKIGMCVKHYSRYCTFLYEEKNANLAESFLNQPFIASKTQLQRKLLYSKMENSKETGNLSSRQSLNVTKNDVQVLLKKCLEAEQVVLCSPGPKEEENFRKCVQALKCRIDAYKKEIQLIQKVTKEIEKKKFQLLSGFNNPRFEELTRELSKTIETLYRTLAKRTSKLEVRESECMSSKETNRVTMPPLVVLKGVDLGEDVSESMKELVYELLVNEVKVEEIRPALCTIMENLIEKDLSVVPSDSWIRNFARVAGLKVRTCNSLLYR